MTKTHTTTTGQMVKFYETTDLIELVQKSVMKFMRAGYSVVNTTKNKKVETVDFELTNGQEEVTVGLVSFNQKLDEVSVPVLTLVEANKVIKRFYKIEENLWTADQNVVRRINKTRAERKLIQEDITLVDVTSPQTIAIAKKLKGFRTVAKKNIMVERIPGQPEYLVTNKTNTRNRKVISLA